MAACPTHPGAAAIGACHRCLVSLGMGVVAITRIDSKAIPPVGNLSAALGAIIFSLFASLIWGVSLLGRIL